MTAILPRSVDYDTVTGVNMSTLLHLQRSPKHYQHNLEHPFESTAAMRLGIAIHCAVLEPERFASKYCIVPRMKSGQVRQEHELTEKQYPLVTSVAKSIRNDPLAMGLLHNSESEQTLVWTDPETGIVCKGRADAISGHILIDLKTTKDATPWGFARSAANLDYHTRMAYYSDGYEIITGHKPSVMVIAVENWAPVDVVVYQLEDDPELDLGRETYHGLLRQLAECRANNHWPGVGGGNIQRLMLPKWKTGVSDTETTEEVE